MKGFVFGKFYPFHKGHEGLIQFALSKCDQLAVLICCSDLEKINGDIRKSWIENTFPNHPNITFIIYNYSEQDLPNTSESSLYVSEKWSVVFKELLPDYQLIVTSEPYGKYVANFMKIANIDFDIARICYPISGTLLRQHIFDYWDYLPVAVQKYLTIKVVLLGTECTGKTSLTEALAKHYQATPIIETARSIIANSNSFELKDLNDVIKEHTQYIESGIANGHPMVIIDTNVFTTISYANFSLKKNLTVDSKTLESNHAHLYFYLTHDLPFTQDGTRLEESKRNSLDQSHRKILHDYHIPFIEISGDWNERFQRCIENIDDFLNHYKNSFN